MPYLDGQGFYHIGVYNNISYNMKSAAFFFSDLNNNLELRAMYNDLVEKEKEKQKGEINNLKVSLLGISSCIDKMRKVSAESQQVCGRLDEVNEILGTE